MPIEILMPALSPTMTEGTLSRWLVSEGSQVTSGDVLAEIETDKATMEIEAVDEGILGKILVGDQSPNVTVNTPIALILEEDEDASVLENATAKPAPAPEESQETPKEAEPEAEVSAPTPEAKAAPAPKAAPRATPEAAPKEGARVFASPLAKRIAAQKNLDLTQITGSGPHGRIILRDVETLADASQLATQATAAVPTATSPVGAPSTFEHVPLSTMRKIIADRLTESKQTIPHFYLSADCTIDALLDLRAQMNVGKEKAEKISVNDIIIKASALALMRQPKANACYDNDAINYFHHADIAVAVSIPDGLITPIIRSADQISLSQIASTTKDLAARAREGKLIPEEYQGGSFTISNLGMFGVDNFQAVINPPHACILAVGRGRKAPIVQADGSLGVATVMNITLSVDHRAVDGAMAALLLEELKALLENPIQILI